MPAATPRMSLFRTAARALTEPHPFARRPVTMASHPVAWSAYTKHVGRTAGSVAPFFALVLGWPILAAKAFGKTTGM